MMIKKLVFLLAAFPVVAAAQVFSAENESGGEIVITDRPCIVKGEVFNGLKESYAWSPRIKKMPACWTFHDGNVVLVYLNDGEERVYPISAFKEKK